MPGPPSLAALGLGCAAAVTASACLGFLQLNRWYPRVQLEDLPKASACRHFIKRAHADSDGSNIPNPHGFDKSGLLSPWSKSSSPLPGPKTHWVPSFVALQVDVPLSRLANYRGGSASVDEERLAKNFMAAFLDARGGGLDGWLLDRDVPPRSFQPGNHLFGDGGGLGAFMLGTWGSSLKTAIQPQTLPASVPHPICDFPTNAAVVSLTPSSAGCVMYWRAPKSLVGWIDRVASYGVPWRFMEGGFQEFIVERISDDMARVSYICVETSNLHPGGQGSKDFKRPPWLFYQAHVAYAQILLLRAVRQLEEGTTP